ncbi:MAG TPA: hypothetical protein PLM07_13205 [Candidatus Rifleibacterium sp.]|nr:hypothetical protein [Candidatus Rifleibacterium sp.]HPT46842.1 hypothetical protein [Candidatus Rifleibacterium sp.]
MFKRMSKLFVAVAALSATCAFASPDGDLKYMGYSQEMVDEVMAATGGKPIADAKSTAETEEADANLEQLTELGVTRSITPGMEDRSGTIRDEILNYWDTMTPTSKNIQPVSDETRALLESNIKTALEASGYSIVQFSLLDLPEGSLKNTLRAVVRVTKPVKTPNSYKEIQASLAEVKQICNQAATIDGVNYLSEMTTFVAENPRNNYYYEKTILKP